MMPTPLPKNMPKMPSPQKDASAQQLARQRFLDNLITAAEAVEPPLTPAQLRSLHNLVKRRRTEAADGETEALMKRRRHAVLYCLKEAVKKEDLHPGCHGFFDERMEMKKKEQEEKEKRVV